MICDFAKPTRMCGAQAMRRKTVVRVMVVALFLAAASGAALAQQNEAATKAPNILVIMGDDIGYWNLSTYNQGMMGYRTPNIDSIANEGIKFTDAYAENSCTAGRSAFITGQSPFRTGLLKVGLPGAKEGLSDKDPTLAELLKPRGYTSGQFGKNHLGDRNEFLPTVHGFDEFFGNLYHLNAEEEPEQEFYPKDPAFKQKFGPRGVLHCYATDSFDSTADPRFGPMGKQKCEDTGPLTRKRMETVDDEFLKSGIDFMERANKAGKPFFVWFASTRMHIYTHLTPQWKGKTGLGVYADGMVEHDSQVGQLLAELKKLGIADNTIVVYTTDNRAELLLWPDGGMIPFHGEKNTTWDGGFRVPMMVKWPGHIKPGGTSNDVISLLDWVPTLMAAAGQPDIKDKLLEGYSVGDTTYKVHLDGYDQTPMLTGKGPGARKEFFYFTDDGSLSALRYNNWKMMFSVQRAHGLAVWQEPYVTLRLPMLFNLRMDPFERAEESEDYPRWRVDNAWAFMPAQVIVAQFLQSFREFPPRAKPGSFSLDQALQKMQQPSNN
jgi:arylsulfatase A-like enzyme